MLQYDLDDTKFRKKLFEKFKKIDGVNLKMTLPAALQARLKKRGLVVEEPAKEEEIKPPKKPNFKLQPLPPGWFLVPDPGSGHEYYWNVHTNQVSWRHPNDPKAEITYPAAWQQPKQTEVAATKANKDGKDASKTEERGILKSSKQKIKTGKHPSMVKAQKLKEKGNLSRKEKASKDNEPLDPMDPASYSDVGRGTWSTGLKEDSEVKTGVDTTANGPLFQQRPYPSPGDILRRNKKQQEEEDE